VTAGDFFSTAIGITGDDYPQIQWQSSPDGVSGWKDIEGEHGLTLVSKPSKATWYRAVASNCWGPQYAAISNAALASVSEAQPESKIAGPTAGPPATTVVQQSPPATTVIMPTTIVQPSPAATQADPSASELALQCSPQGMALLTVFESRRNALVTGVADERHVGKRISIYGVFTNKQLGSALVAKNGHFQAHVKLPPLSVRNTNRARYYASYGGAKTAKLKLRRRVQANLPVVTNGTVRISGHVRKPYAKSQRQVRIERRVSCNKWRSTKTVKMNASGHFSATFRTPKGVQAAVYRASGKVPKTAGGKRLSSTFSIYRYTQFK
jgi:hypothetical protein